MMMLSDTSLLNIIMRDAPASRVFDCYNRENSWFAKHKYEVANEINENSMMVIHARNLSNGMTVEFPVKLHAIEFIDSGTSDIHSRIFVTFDPKVYDMKFRNNELCYEVFNNEKLNNFRLSYGTDYGQGHILKAVCFFD